MIRDYLQEDKGFHVVQFAVQCCRAGRWRLTVQWESKYRIRIKPCTWGVHFCSLFLLTSSSSSCWLSPSPSSTAWGKSVRLRGKSDIVTVYCILALFPIKGFINQRQCMWLSCLYLCFRFLEGRGFILKLWVQFSKVTFLLCLLWGSKLYKVHMHIYCTMQYAFLEYFCAFSDLRWFTATSWDCVLNWGERSLNRCLQGRTSYKKGIIVINRIYYFMGIHFRCITTQF